LNSIITVGITGGIGTGKSVVCRILNIMGYPVFYSDTESKILLNSDDAAIEGVRRIFGNKAYENQLLNRPLLAEQIFNEPGKREQLNALVHPLVRKRFKEWTSQQQSLLVFNEAAILFETGSYKNNDFNVLVTSPLSLRITRVKQRDNITEEQIKERIASQWSDDKKIPLADFVIVNDEVQMLIPQVLQLLNKLKK